METIDNQTFTSRQAASTWLEEVIMNRYGVDLDPAFNDDLLWEYGYLDNANHFVLMIDDMFSDIEYYEFFKEYTHA